MSVDFAVLPPEVNSGRMYAGAGAGPLMTAAAAWDQLASELTAAASSYRQTVVGLVDGQWQGASSAAMSAAAEPYVAWMSSTAARAEQTAGQARSAAAAYQTAFAATVPPTLVAGNRSTLASLVATNIAGQNTAAIAATEAQYAEMWAQDVAAMYAYAGASAGATQVAEFTPAPPTTSPNAAAAQSAASNQAAASATANGLSAVPSALQSAAAGTPPAIESILGNLSAINGMSSGYAFGTSAPILMADGVLVILGPMVATLLGPVVGSLSAGASVAGVTEGVGAGLGSTLASSSLGASGAAGLGAGVSAGVGEAASVGRMSVPASWGVAPAMKLASGAVPALSLGAAPAAGIGGMGGFGGVPMMGPVGSIVNAPRNGEAYSHGPRSKALPKWAAETSGHDRHGSRAAQRSESEGIAAPIDVKDGIEQLRAQIAELAKERDVLRETASFMLDEAQEQ